MQNETPDEKGLENAKSVRSSSIPQIRAQPWD